MTYRDVARGLGLSEASVKRLFSRRGFTLERLERVCELMDLSLSDLVHLADSEHPEVSELTEAQENELLADRKLLLLAVLSMNGWQFDEIRTRYQFTDPELIGYLARLDRLRFIELLPRNRIRLRVSRNFKWRKDGPVELFFNRHARDEFLDGNFNNADASLQFVFGRLSRRSNAIIQHRLEQVVNEFNELHLADMKLPFEERHGNSILLAMRRWELRDFTDLRRGKHQTDAGT
jgi:DNA-binding Xre family transcriptional regulator